MTFVNKAKTFQVHVSTMGCAGITVDRLLCRGFAKQADSPPPPEEVRLVAVLSRHGEVLGTTPLSSVLRQAPTKGRVTNTSRHRFLALWTESKVPSTITFNVDLQELSKQDGKLARSAACSRLTSKDFELYLAVVWDEHVNPIPIAAASLSLRAGMESKLYDLPLYPVNQVDFAVFRPLKSPSYEEKKEDAAAFDQPITSKAYGIDSLDALLRVQITINECQEFSEASKSVELTRDAIELIRAGTDAADRGSGPTVECYQDSEAELPRIQIAPASIGAETIAAPISRWSDPIDDLSAASQGSSKTSSDNRIVTKSPPKHSGTVTRSQTDPEPGLELSHSTTEASEELLTNETIDDDSLDDNTFDTNEGTVLSHDTFRPFREQIQRVERFVESISLPECKRLDKDLSFDDEESTLDHQDSVSYGVKSAPFDIFFARSQCGALGPLREWLKSHDGDDHDEFRSIITYTTRGTATSGEDPGLGEAKRPSGLQTSLAEERFGATDESTMDGTLNSFPLDERSYPHQPEDRLYDSVIEASHGDYRVASRQKQGSEPACSALNLFECNERSGDVRSPDTFTEASTTRNQMLCTDLEAVDQALTKLVPKPKASVVSSEGYSPKHIEGFPGLMEGNFKNLFRFRKTGKEAGPPMHLVKSFPDPDGDYSSVGDLTLTTHELRLEIDRTDEEFVLLRNRSKTLLPAPSSTLSSFFACKATSKNSGADAPFDEADPFKLDTKSNAMAPDLSAAVGLAWAKQNAERANRRHHPVWPVS